MNCGRAGKRCRILCGSLRRSISEVDSLALLELLQTQLRGPLPVVPPAAAPTARFSACRGVRALSAFLAHVPVGELGARPREPPVWLKAIVPPHKVTPASDGFHGDNVNRSGAGFTTSRLALDRGRA